jgi:hypothetical protein
MNKIKNEIVSVGYFYMNSFHSFSVFENAYDFTLKKLEHAIL